MKKRGGAREGSGRHTKGEALRITTSLMMDGALKARCQEEAKRRGISLSDLVHVALKKELGE